jgi:hypothetical protein
MTDIKVRNLDDSVATALRSRAKAKGARSRRRCVGPHRVSRVGRGGVRPPRPGNPHCDRAQVHDAAADSIATIREQRDAWG